MLQKDLVPSDSRSLPAVLSLAHCASNILFNIIPVVFYWIRSGKWQAFSGTILYTIHRGGFTVRYPTSLLVQHHRYLTKQHFSSLLQGSMSSAMWDAPVHTNVVRHSDVMCIFVAHLVAWMNVAILLSPQDETADCTFLNHWVAVTAVCRGPKIRSSK